jgi:hypothetical protein
MIKKVDDLYTDIAKDIAAGKNWRHNIYERDQKYIMVINFLRNELRNSKYRFAIPPRIKDVLDIIDMPETA